MIKDSENTKFWLYKDNENSLHYYPYSKFSHINHFTGEMTAHPPKKTAATVENPCNEIPLNDSPLNRKLSPEELEYVMGVTKPTVKVETGLPYLDAELEGMSKGSLVLITGNAGAGKTMLANQIFRSVMNTNDNILWKAGNASKAGFGENASNPPWYTDLDAAVNSLLNQRHLVVFDDLPLSDPRVDFRLLRGKLLDETMGWAIVTLQTKDYFLSSAVADYVFHIERWGGDNFKIKCVKNRHFGSRNNGVIVKHQPMPLIQV